MADSHTNGSIEDEEGLTPSELDLRDTPASPSAPRATQADSDQEGSPTDVGEDLAKPPALPPAKDHEKLRLAASDMVEFEISLDNAAAHHGVDPDTLHVFYRTYVKFVGKDNVQDPHGSYASVDLEEFDRGSHRQFDRNWAEMTFQAERDRTQLSGARRWLVGLPLTSWMFNGSVLDKIAVTGAVCVIALGLLAFKLTRKDADPNPEPPATPATWNQGEDIAGLHPDQQIDLLNQILEALSVFIATETWQERLPLVRHPEEVKPLMESYYNTHPDGPITPIIVEPDFSFLDRTDGKFALVRAKRKKADSDDLNLIYLIEISADQAKFLIDWKVLVNYEPILWEEFKLAKITSPSAFRVKISPGDYYNQPFMDQKRFISFKLSFFLRPKEEAFGYAERDSELAKTLLKLLSSELDKSQAAVLNLRFPEDAKFDNVVEIESMLSDNW